MARGEPEERLEGQKWKALLSGPKRRIKTRECSAPSRGSPVQGYIESGGRGRLGGRELKAASSQLLLGGPVCG